MVAPLILKIGKYSNTYILLGKPRGLPKPLCFSSIPSINHPPTVKLEASAMFCKVILVSPGDTELIRCPLYGKNPLVKPTPPKPIFTLPDPIIVASYAFNLRFLGPAILKNCVDVEYVPGGRTASIQPSLTLHI